jgi:hypothetical protein
VFAATNWPEAAMVIAFMVLIAFIYWVMYR